MGLLPLWKPQEIALCSSAGQHKAVALAAGRIRFGQYKKPPNVLTSDWTFGGFCVDEEHDDGRQMSHLWDNVNAKCNHINTDIWIDKIANIGYNDFTVMEV